MSSRKICGSYCTDPYWTAEARTATAPISLSPSHTHQIAPTATELMLNGYLRAGWETDEFDAKFWHMLLPQAAHGRKSLQIYKRSLSYPVTEACLELEMLWGSLLGILKEVEFRRTAEDIKCSRTRRDILDKQAQKWDEGYREPSYTLQRPPTNSKPASLGAQRLRLVAS